MVRLVQRMHKGSKAVEYFAVNEWEWEQGNVSQLREELDESDKYKFYFDVSLINWEDYLEDYIKGTRQYFFKEDLSTMEEARRHQTTMFWVDKAFQVELMLSAVTIYHYIIFQTVGYFILFKILIWLFW